MDQRIVEQKLESLRRCIRRVETKTPSSASELEDDVDLQDIISVNLERAVHLCVNVGTHINAFSEENAPNTLGETFELLSRMAVLKKETPNIMKKTVGFRNISVHNDETINWNMVYSICTKQLDDFRQFARKINTYISDSPHPKR